MVCAHQAITMQYDNIGRLLPIIDEAKCNNCGLCYSHCPSLDLKGIQLPNSEDKYVGHVDKVCIGKATDEKIYKNSQSGGLVTATVKYLFESAKIDAAIMCSVVDAIEYTPKAVVVTSVDELYACQKSSYVPIDIVSAMKQTDCYHSIAVVGTGCHIQGIRALQNYNKKYKEKIKYTLGLICDRTLCKTATDVLYGSHYKGESKKLVWRDKSLNYKKARILIKTTENKIAQVPTWKRHALKDSFTNPRCRICFDKLNTGADIVFGDPWGMNNVDWKNGMSVVLTRTETGCSIIEKMLSQGYVSLVEAPLSEVIAGQHIEKRKETVSSAIETYEKQQWLLPSYSCHLKNTDVSQSIRKEIEEKIKEFVSDSSKDKEYILQKNLHYLRKMRVKKLKTRCISLFVIILKKIMKR